MNKKQYVVLIPTLDPDFNLIPYVKELLSSRISKVIIINDGSQLEYGIIFDRLQEIENCIVLGYETNKGKGAALKYGLDYVKENLADYFGIITADSDGQHQVNDVWKLCDLIEDNFKSLIIGFRKFDKGVPFKSYWGNLIASTLFFIFNFKWLQDTQTGLRGFSMDLIDILREIPGNRFEYEINVLSNCVKKRISIIEVNIKTIYFDNNKKTHFRPLKDSVMILNALLGNFKLFIFSSFVATLIDLVLAWQLFDLLKNMFDNNLIRIMISTVLARIISLNINYWLNYKKVFKVKNNRFNYLRYLFLCILVMFLSGNGVYLMELYLSFSEKNSKLIVDSLLFILSYNFQKNWIFKN